MSRPASCFFRVGAGAWYLIRRASLRILHDVVSLLMAASTVPQHPKQPGHRPACELRLQAKSILILWRFATTEYDLNMIPDHGLALAIASGEAHFRQILLSTNPLLSAPLVLDCQQHILI